MKLCSRTPRNARPWFWAWAAIQWQPHSSRRSTRSSLCRESRSADVSSLRNRSCNYLAGLTDRSGPFPVFRDILLLVRFENRILRMDLQQDCPRSTFIEQRQMINVESVCVPLWKLDTASYTYGRDRCVTREEATLLLKYLFSFRVSQCFRI